MKLNRNKQEMLWGEEGPYSEAKIIINHRILDDSVSRVMLEIEGNVNPTTFEIVEKHRSEFADDPFITQLLDTAVHDGKEYGYHICAGMEEYLGDESMENAEVKLEYMKNSIIRMHRFVMEQLENE